MSLKNRIFLLIIVDSAIAFFSIFLGYFILYPAENVSGNTFLLTSALAIFIAHHAIALYYGLYRKIWVYASIGELTLIFKITTLSVLTVGSMQLFFHELILIRALAITWMLHLLLIGGSRFSWRMLRNYKVSKERISQKRTMIIGAGSAGTLVARQLLNNPKKGLLPVLFIDDDASKKGLEIFGIRVAGPTDAIEAMAKNYEIEHIVIAIPSLSKYETAKLIKLCLTTGIRIQTIPFFEDLMTGRLAVTDMQDVKVEDLLGREEIQLDMKDIAAQLSEKTVLVTGAGGSIGSEITRQIADFNPARLLLLGHGENSIYTIDMELRRKNETNMEFIPIIADIQDRRRMMEIMKFYKPDIVYHAAAHKHVPLMEGNPMEAVKNNIYGTKNVAEAAHLNGVESFVMISTDKAVNPPNIMGATKRFAEMIVQNLAKKSETKFTAVRFGNVLGSSGSVVPLFKEQIARGGPITVTHPEMTRYFMTIPEASRLVIQAGVLAEGGEVFVLDMGKPVKLVDLAKNMIRLHSYAEGEIEIQFTGIRPGEKLFEELLNADEIQTEQVFPKIYIGKANPISELELNSCLKEFPKMENEKLKKMLLNLANGNKKETIDEEFIDKVL